MSHTKIIKFCQNHWSLLNISADILTYLTNFLFPFGGFGPSSATEAPADFLSLDAEYTALLARQFDNNALRLLGNITKSCSQIVVRCVFGMFLKRNDCCRFFGGPEFVFGQVCYRSSAKLRFRVQETGMFNSMMVTMAMNGSGLEGLSPRLLNDGARLLAGQVSAAVAEKESHTFAVSPRQDKSGFYLAFFFL